MRNASSTSSTRTVLSRVRSHRQAVRGRRELSLALTGYYGRGVQADVLAAQARQG